MTMAHDVTTRVGVDATTPARAARTPRRRGGQWAAWAFLVPIVIYLVAFYAYPLYRNLDLRLCFFFVCLFVLGGAPNTGQDN